MTADTQKQLFQMKGGTSKTARLIAKLNVLLSFPEAQVNLDEILHRFAALTAEMFDADDCAIILLKQDETLGLHSRSGFGKFSAIRIERPVKKLQAIAEPPITSGKIARTNGKLQYTRDAHKRSMFAAIMSNGKTIGVIHVHEPKNKHSFDLSDLRLLEISALSMAKSIRLIQLQTILNSRFIKIALALNSDNMTGPAQPILPQHPHQVSKIVAKSFYREMKKAGFGRSQIINAASEILSQLNDDVRKPREKNSNEVLAS